MAQDREADSGDAQAKAALERQIRLEDEQRIKTAEAIIHLVALHTARKNINPDTKVVENVARQGRVTQEEVILFDTPEKRDLIPPELKDFVASQYPGVKFGEDVEFADVAFAVHRDPTSEGRILVTGHIGLLSLHRRVPLANVMRIATQGGYSMGELAVMISPQGGVVVTDEKGNKFVQGLKMNFQIDPYRHSQPVGMERMTYSIPRHSVDDFDTRVNTIPVEGAFTYHPTVLLKMAQIALQYGDALQPMMVQR